MLLLSKVSRSADKEQEEVW